ncbi:hypothetical protein ACFLUZ_03355 [Chloroflexota bacterium]
MSCQNEGILSGGQDEMKVTPERGIYEVVWPRGRRVVKESHCAQRLGSLEGKTICELSDRIFHADDVFSILEKELASRYPGLKFVSYEEFGNIHGGEEAEVIPALPGRFKRNKCDAVISAMGC